MNSIFSLEEKRILITGASSGIGRAVAQQCAAAGASCILSARNKSRLQGTLERMGTGDHETILADLSTDEGVLSLVDSLPIVDGVVCCAGIVETKLLKFTEDTDLTNLFNTNAFSAIRLIRGLVQSKKLSKGTSIVVISSISGVKCGYLGGSIYGATKGALEGFVKAAALELAPRKIRVNSITPGMIDTSLMKDSQIDSDQLIADMQRYPMKRYGKPEEIGYAAVYLLSDATVWMTGTSLLIDGGYTLN